MSRNQNPALKWSTRNHASRIKKAAAAISGWDCPLPTFIYPGFVDQMPFPKHLMEVVLLLVPSKPVMRVTVMANEMLHAMA